MSDLLSSAKSTICITCRHVSQFKSINTPTVPSFLRMLVTKNGENICNLREPLLEQPNIVYGVTAGGLYLNNTTVYLPKYTVWRQNIVFSFSFIVCRVYGVTFSFVHFIHRQFCTGFIVSWTSIEIIHLHELYSARCCIYWEKLFQ